MLYLSLSIISLNLLALLARYFFGELVGIDVNIAAEGKRIEPNIKLEKQSIDDTNFEDETFSFIFSYHVLEHVDDPVKALKELHRIMKNGAVLFIGFPNKHRIVGYIGSQNDVSITDKILWNLNDFKKKLRGSLKIGMALMPASLRRNFYRLRKAFSTRYIW